MRFIISDKIPELLGKLSAAGQAVWAPQVIRDTVNTVLFAPWEEGGDLSLDMYTSVSAKEMVLPSTERLFSFRYRFMGEGEAIEISSGEEQVVAPPAVIFGARACDAAALGVLDALFNAAPGSSYNDPGYRARRRALTVITLACTTCDSACFCSSFGDGPGDKSGSDIFLYPIAGGFLAEPLTDSGNEIVNEPPFEDSCQAPPALVETSRVDLDGLAAKLKAGFPDMELWERVTERCLSCGYCTYCCPTCYCFNIFDEMRSDREGERLRGWDACMFHQYTQETSGHNPRPAVAHRYRNRLSHKFWYYPENRGRFLCTGCGRCIRGCPGNLDIREALMAVRERADNGAAVEAEDQARVEGQAKEEER